jgi:hypothetical protein
MSNTNPTNNLRWTQLLRLAVNVNRAIMGMATLSEMITTTYQLGILDSPSVRVSSITTTYQLGILDSPSVRVSSITTTYQLGILDSPSIRVSSITTTYQLGILDSPSVRVSSNPLHQEYCINRDIYIPSPYTSFIYFCFNETCRLS